MTFSVPIAFFVFNRPDTTKRVFEQIAQIRPERLLLVADGARANRPEEAARCREVRAILEQVNWPCEVSRNFSDTNLGCRKRVSSGLDWVFSEVERAIILEEDCLPHPDFFPFCANLLEHYENNPRIMHISGTNMQLGNRRGDASYYFSIYNPIWGWASWRRAWRRYDVNIRKLPEFTAAGGLQKFLPSPKLQKNWARDFQLVYENKIDTWDYQWTFALWDHDGLSITPNVNLISNIGFAKDALHTRDTSSKLSNMPTLPIGGNLIHPQALCALREADAFVEKNFMLPSLMERVRYKINTLLSTGKN